MARRVRDSDLETRAARGKLKARGKPYYRAIGEGLHLGYRKGDKSAGGCCAAMSETETMWSRR